MRGIMELLPLYTVMERESEQAHMRLTVHVRPSLHLTRRRTAFIPTVSPRTRNETYLYMYTQQCCCKSGADSLSHTCMTLLR